MPAFGRDDNDVPLHDPTGLRPAFSAAVRAATSTNVAEVSIASATSAAFRGQQNQIFVRVACVGANAAYFSTGPASATVTNGIMMTLPSNSVTYMTLTSTDASMYIQQITGASTIEVVPLL